MTVAADPRPFPPRDDEPPRIETRGLGRAFGSRQAVDGLDLRIRRGEIYGLLGPNGAGKTTTLRMLCGLLRPSSGNVLIDGHADPDQHARIRARIGFAPETPPIEDFLTGRQHVAFVASLYGVDASERDRRCHELLEGFDLLAHADDLCRSFSGGMRKKIHLVAVLVTAPQVLLLDEPTTGLDPRSSRQLKDRVQQLARAGTTVVLSTHVLGDAEEVCDRIGILSSGVLREEGSAQELVARNGEPTLERVFLSLTSTAR